MSSTEQSKPQGVPLRVHVSDKTPVVIKYLGLDTGLVLLPTPAGQKNNTGQSEGCEKSELLAQYSLELEQSEVCRVDAGDVECQTVNNCPVVSTKKDVLYQACQTSLERDVVVTACQTDADCKKDVTCQISSKMANDFCQTQDETPPPVITPVVFDSMCLRRKRNVKEMPCQTSLSLTKTFQDARKEECASDVMSESGAGGGMRCQASCSHSQLVASESASDAGDPSQTSAGELVLSHDGSSASEQQFGHMKMTSPPETHRNFESSCPSIAAYKRISHQMSPSEQGSYEGPARNYCYKDPQNYSTSYRSPYSSDLETMGNETWVPHLCSHGRFHRLDSKSQSGSPNRPITYSMASHFHTENLRLPRYKFGLQWYNDSTNDDTQPPSGCAAGNKQCDICGRTF
ncbi:hypothetical protein PoB_002768000 [Plakobranchus ocellatus]|uniref:Uncharacterized protein n=1 Tax=Plakobranchus ocellatus TaxID=259542 RepID=A0AAV4A189_9GAST|nr:hypothetical protein PoB_002768000 [Plakobranchus ocellatus]